MNDFNGKLRDKDKEYKLVFNLNVMQRIQEEYGSIEKWGAMTDAYQGEPNAKAVLFGITEMINEGVDMDNEEHGTNTAFFTQKQIGRMLTEIGMQEAAQALNNTVVNSVKTETKNA